MVDFLNGGGWIDHFVSTLQKADYLISIFRAIRKINFVGFKQIMIIV